MADLAIKVGPQPEAAEELNLGTETENVHFPSDEESEKDEEHEEIDMLGTATGTRGSEPLDIGEPGRNLPAGATDEGLETDQPSFLRGMLSSFMSSRSRSPGPRDVHSAEESEPHEAELLDRDLHRRQSPLHALAKATIEAKTQSTEAEEDEFALDEAVQQPKEEAEKSETDTAEMNLQALRRQISEMQQVLDDVPVAMSQSGGPSASLKSSQLEDVARDLRSAFTAIHAIEVAQRHADESIDRVCVECINAAARLRAMETQLHVLRADVDRVAMRQAQSEKHVHRQDELIAALVRSSTSISPRTSPTARRFLRKHEHPDTSSSQLESMEGDSFDFPHVPAEEEKEKAKSKLQETWKRLKQQYHFARRALKSNKSTAVKAASIGVAVVAGIGIGLAVMQTTQWKEFKEKLRGNTAGSETSTSGGASGAES
ncbi:MAG: hypothetical protein MHM6MM_002290 [Cercozoa sp. M6MM]